MPRRQGQRHEGRVVARGPTQAVPAAMEKTRPELSLEMRQVVGVANAAAWDAAIQRIATVPDPPSAVVLPPGLDLDLIARLLQHLASDRALTGPLPPDNRWLTQDDLRAQAEALRKLSKLYG